MVCVLLSVLLFLVAGCIPVPCEIEKPELSGQRLVDVSFDIDRKDMLRSSISPDEAAVCDINLYAFCEGKLVAYDYFPDGISMQLKLLYGHTYNLYALANMGQVESPVSESEFRNKCVFQIDDIQGVGECLPMAWELSGFTIDSYSDRVRLDFERQIAKVLFSVDMSVLKGLEVKSIELCQSPLAVWPFMSDDGSLVSDADLVDSGDFATDADLQVVNSGGKIEFYVLENCQGCLLPENDDPWMKVPSMIGEKAQLCTYLQIVCSFNDGVLYSGDVVYRIYLGQDSYSDFNVRANSVLDVSLCLTDDGLNAVSWRVNADISLNEGYAGGYLKSGLHSIDDLYVGEKFIYSVVLQDDMMDYLDGDVTSMHVALADGSAQQNFIFGDFVYKESDGGRTYFDVEVTCCHPGSGTLGLFDDYGRMLCVLDEYMVREPYLCVSFDNYSSFYRVVSGKINDFTIPINGDAEPLYLYLTDKEGRNLNSKQGPGFELSLFDLDSYVSDIDEIVLRSLEMYLQKGVSANDGPLGSLMAHSLNPGTDNELNKKLMEFVTEDRRGVLRFEVNEFSLFHDIDLGFNSLPITLTLVDNGWAGYYDCQISMKVDNPSNLPLNVECWQLHFADDQYNSITHNQAVSQYGSVFLTSPFECVSGYDPEVPDPIYASVHRFRCDRSQYGNSAVEDGDLLVFPLSELSSSLLYYALAYDYYGQKSMSHHIDVSFADGSAVSNVTAIDNLSNGSQMYEIIYGNDPDADGWNNRGIWMYSLGDLLMSAGNDFQDCSYIGTEGLYGLESGMTGSIILGYDDSSNNFYASVDKNRLAGTMIDAEFEIDVDGYVQTTPNGTWGKKVNNYCSASVTRKIEGIQLGTSPVAIDGEAVIDAMNAIYAKTYVDSYNKIGSSKSYQHSAHPTELNVKVKLTLSGDYRYQVLPVDATMPSKTSFYHSQEGVTYSVPMASSCPLHRIAIVENLSN